MNYILDLLRIPAAQAQLTWSATDANTQLSATYSGVVAFMWQNLAAVLIFGAVVGLVWFFYRKIKGGAKGRA